MSVQEQTQDTVKEVLELTSNIVLEVKAAAGTGGSIMAAVNKLEEVHTYVENALYICAYVLCTLPYCVQGRVPLHILHWQECIIHLLILCINYPCRMGMHVCTY